MMPDDPRRARVGVVACIVRDGDRVRLVLDDVRADSDAYPQTWRSEWPFTRNDYNAATFESELSEEDYAKIGQALVFRLLATTR